MSEATEAMMIVVSEESGQISVILGGTMHGNLSAKELRTMTNDYLREDRKSRGAEASAPASESEPAAAVEDDPEGLPKGA